MEKEDLPEPEEEESEPERPLECSECRKLISVYYYLLVGKEITLTGMCSECPQLQRRLHGKSGADVVGELQEGVAGVACGRCSTTLAQVIMGTPLGCSDCYQVFEEELFRELVESQRVPEHLHDRKRSSPLHVGRAPGEQRELKPSMRLLALHEALSETLKREDYEQAALLRDQIKKLTEQVEEREEEGSDEK